MTDKYKTNPQSTNSPDSSLAPSNDMSSSPHPQNLLLDFLVDDGMELLLRYSYKYILTDDTITPDYVEELIQITLLKASNYCHTFKGKSKFSTWVIRILINTHLTLWKRQAQRERKLKAKKKYNLSSLEEQSSKGIKEAIDAKHDIWKALLKLPPKLRQIILLRYIDGLPRRIVADIMGLSITTIRNYESEAFENMQTYFGRD